MNPVKVEIVFENCECIECPPSAIRVCAKGAKHVPNFPHEPKNHLRFDTEYLRLRITPKYETLINRVLECRDITYIYITYDSGLVVVLGVPWNDEFGEVNTFQSQWHRLNHFEVIIDRNADTAKAKREIAFNRLHEAIEEAMKLRDEYEKKYGVSIMSREEMMKVFSCHE